MIFFMDCPGNGWKVYSSETSNLYDVISENTSAFDSFSYTSCDSKCPLVKSEIIMQEVVKASSVLL